MHWKLESRQFMMTMGRDVLFESEANINNPILSKLLLN